MSTLRNSVQLLGFVGADAEVKTLENGNKVARVSVATTESYKSKSGEWVNDTTWHNIVMWESLAERAERQLIKGVQVIIDGKLTNRNYTDAKGEKKYIYEVRGTNFILLDKKENSAQESMIAPEDQNDILPF